jgi:hypothetical protein
LPPRVVDADTAQGKWTEERRGRSALTIRYVANTMNAINYALYIQPLPIHKKVQMLVSFHDER